MATIRIEFSTDNAAFEDDYKGEIYRMLIQARDSLTGERSRRTLCDSNGNTVGKVTVSE